MRYFCRDQFTCTAILVIPLSSGTFCAGALCRPRFPARAVTISRLALNEWLCPWISWRARLDVSTIVLLDASEPVSVQEMSKCRALNPRRANSEFVTTSSYSKWLFHDSPLARHSVDSRTHRSATRMGTNFWTRSC
jgi:hypothetical protein